MKNITISTLKTFVIIGLLVGIGCGFLYGIGGFIHDYILMGINRGSYLALNALWGMALIFGGIGLVMGLLFSLLRFVLKR
jgi:hypothetical protein